MVVSDSLPTRTSCRRRTCNRATPKHLHRQTIVIRHERAYDRACARQDELTEKLVDGIELSHAEAAELEDLGLAIAAFEDRNEERTGWR